jgi:pimeloyl-ACP methyl ester carboxylesterase
MVRPMAPPFGNERDPVSIRRPRLALILLLALPAGCSPDIGVRRSSQADALSSWRLSKFENQGLSQRTCQTLRRLNLDGLLPRHADVVNDKLLECALHDPLSDYLFALAEINYSLAQQAENRDDALSLTRYYLCAGYAYHFLFYSRDDTLPDGLGAEAHRGTNTFDPRHRLACDLYNAGLAKCIRAAQRIGRLDPRHKLQLVTRTGDFTLSVDHYGFAWKTEEFGPLLFCADYEVIGLDNHYHTFGLGVPLIGMRAESDKPAPGYANYPRDVSFPVTAFFRFESNLADLAACQSGRLELYDPLRIQNVQVAGQAVALETDLTTPLAFFMDKTHFVLAGLEGFFRADSAIDKAGIYLFEPYQAGKIPVVLTHGLLSSPQIWTRMYNDLRADPVLRDRYQFWFFLYPTANSYLATAADLREALDGLRSSVDPEHADAAFEQMVLVGHSMGGLVDKLLTQESGDDFWKFVTERPFSDIKGDPDSLKELHRVFFFERYTAVKRVVFLGTPHRGSNLSAPGAYLLDRFVRLSDDLTRAGRNLVKDNPELWPTLAKNPNKARLPTSLDLLTPSAPALEVLAQRGPPAGVHYHSIIGINQGEGKTAGDGFVPFESARINGVDSELVVPVGHRELHDYPRDILEVSRILHLHLDELKTPSIRSAADGQTP